ncbi:Beige/BEACH domain containing protein [Entamoeba marina]
MNELIQYYLTYLTYTKPNIVDDTNKRLNALKNSDQIIPVVVDEFIKLYLNDDLFTSQYFYIILDALNCLFTQQYHDICKQFFSQQNIIEKFALYWSKLFSSTIQEQTQTSLITFGTSLFNSFTFTNIPMPLFILDFNHPHITYSLLVVYNSLITSMSQLSFKSSIDNICKAFVITSQSLLTSSPSQYHLTFIHSILDLILCSCSSTCQLLITATNTDFFKYINTFILSMHDHNHKQSELFSIISNLHHLSYHGTLNTSDINIVNRIPYGRIRNKTTPHILFSLLTINCSECLKLLHDSIESLLFSHNSNVEILEDDILNHCKHLTTFTKDTSLFTFKLLNNLYQNRTLSLSLLTTFIIPLITIKTFRNTSLMITLLDVITKIIGSSRSAQSQLSKLLQPILNVFISAVQFPSQNYSILHYTSNALCSLLAASRSNADVLIATPNAITNLLNAFRVVDVRYHLAPIFRELIGNIAAESASLLATGILEGMVCDDDPISRLKTAVEIMKMSNVSREVFGVIGGFGLIKDFQELWKTAEDLDGHEKSKKERNYGDVKLLENEASGISNLLNMEWGTKNDVNEVMFWLFALATERSIEKVREFSINSFTITNPCVLPTYLRALQRLPSSNRSLHLHLLTTALTDPVSLYGAYRAGVIGVVLGLYPEALVENCEATDLIKKIGKYSLNRRELTEVLSKPINTVLLNSINAMTQNDGGSGLTFDTADGKTCCYGSIWLDGLPCTMTFWLFLSGGSHDLITLTKPNGTDQINVKVKGNRLFVTTKETTSFDILLNTWFFVSFVFNDVVTCYINSVQKAILPSVDVSQGTHTICIGHVSPRITQYIFCIGDDVVNRTGRIGNSERKIEGRVCPTSPQPFCEVICKCGGIQTLLNLISQTSTNEEFCSSLEILTNCISRSSEIGDEMDQWGFEVFHLLLVEKQKFIFTDSISLILKSCGIDTAKWDIGRRCKAEVLERCALDMSIYVKCVESLVVLLSSYLAMITAQPKNSIAMLESAYFVHHVIEIFYVLGHNTERSSMDIIFQSVVRLLGRYFTNKCCEDDVHTVVNATTYFMNETINSTNQDIRISNEQRCYHLIGILNEIITTNKEMATITYSIVLPLLFNAPTSLLFTSILRFICEISVISLDFSTSFYDIIDDLYDKMEYIQTPDGVDALFSLTLHISPSSLLKPIDISTLYPKYLLLVHHVLYTHIQNSVKPKSLTLLLYTLTSLLSWSKRITQFHLLLLTENDVVNSLLTPYQLLLTQQQDIQTYYENTLFNDYTHDEYKQIEHGISTIQEEFISLLSYQISKGIVRNEDYQPFIINILTFKSNTSFIQTIIESTSSQLVHITPKPNTKQLTDFSTFLIDIFVTTRRHSTPSITPTLLTSIISKFYNLSQKTMDQRLWQTVVDRLYITLFDSTPVDVLEAIELYLGTPTFMSMRHSDNFHSSLLALLFPHILTSTSETMSHMCVGVIKTLVMNNFAALERILPSPNLKAGFDMFLRNDAAGVLQWFVQHNNEINEVLGTLTTSLNIARSVNEEQTEILTKRIRACRADKNKKEYSPKATTKQKKNMKKRINKIIEQLTIERNQEQLWKLIYNSFEEFWKKEVIKNETNSKTYRIDEVEGAFGIQRRIIKDDQFDEKYNYRLDDKTQRVVVSLKSKDVDKSVVLELMNEESIVIQHKGFTIYQCAIIDGLNELRCLLIITSSIVACLHIINTTPNSTNLLPNFAKCKVLFQYPHNQIIAFTPRRYLLQPFAIELSTCYGKNHLFVFPTNAESFLKTVNRLVRTQRLQDSPKLFHKLNSVFTQNDEMTTLWCHGEVSTFEYLMYLNTKAGRSFNDISQYPIFPWVLSDYTSETLVLSNPKVYRDLKYPVTAQTSERRAALQRKYIETNTHYGNHYSSVGTTLFLLYRTDPYTSMHINLFDGHFDSDRLFISIPKLYSNLAASPLELIPQFFCLPQILHNFNRLDFGRRRDNAEVDDAILPPWAQNSSRCFVAYNLLALESSYVSQNLPDWIDLIFGFKQRGRAAIDSCNVYPALSYSCDLLGLTPERRIAAAAQIRHCGQTPLQLFKNPHPRRTVEQTIWTAGVFDSKLVINILKNTAFPIGDIIFDKEKDSFKVFRHDEFATDTSVICINTNDIIIQRNNKKIVIEDCARGGVVISASSRLLVIGGRDGVVDVFDINETPERIGRLFGKCCGITGVCVSSINHVVVSGDENGWCAIWDIPTCHLLHSFEVGCEVIDIQMNEETGDIIVLTSNQLMLFDINGDLLDLSKWNQDEATAVRVYRTPIWIGGVYIVTGHKSGEIRFWRLGNVVNDDKKEGDKNQLISSIGVSKNRITILKFIQTNQLCVGDLNGVVSLVTTDI